MRTPRPTRGLMGPSRVEGGMGLLGIVKVHPHQCSIRPREHLLVLVPLAGEHHHVARRGVLDGVTDGPGAIGLHHHAISLVLRDAREDLIDDIAGAF